MPARGFPCGSAGKESACNAGDLGLIAGLGRSPGEGKGYPLQCSGLENSMDFIVHGVAKSWTRRSNFHSQYDSKFGKLNSSHRTGKSQFSFQSQKRAVLKNVQNARQLHSFCILVRLYSKSFTLGFMNRELPDAQAGLWEHRGTGDQIANTHWIIEKVREFQKHLLLFHLLH